MTTPALAAARPATRPTDKTPVVDGAAVADLLWGDHYPLSETALAARLTANGWTSARIAEVAGSMPQWWPEWHFRHGPHPSTPAPRLDDVRRQVLGSLAAVPVAAAMELRAATGPYGWGVRVEVLGAAAAGVPVEWLAQVVRIQTYWDTEGDAVNLHGLEHDPEQVWKNLATLGLAAMPDAVGWVTLAAAAAEDGDQAGEPWDWDLDALRALETQWAGVPRPWRWRAAGYDAEEAGRIAADIDADPGAVTWDDLWSDFRAHAERTVRHLPAWRTAW